jgi:hypothetical protein
MSRKSIFAAKRKSILGAKRRPILRAVGLGVAGSAVAGYGLSIGRDAWKGTKKIAVPLLFWTAVLLLIASPLILPFLGGRNLVRSYAAPAARQFWGVLSGVLLIVAGASLSLSLALLLMLDDSRDSTSTSLISDPNILISDPNILISSPNIRLWLAATATAIGLGVIFGLAQRGSRRKRFNIAKKNDAFLEKMGFVETGEQEITHYDGEGNPLRLLDQSDDTITFLAVGKRNKRAYIRLTDGEMTGYTSVMPIDASREYIRP